jgi:hypothetical protein
MTALGYSALAGRRRRRPSPPCPPEAEVNSKHWAFAGGRCRPRFEARSDPSVRPEGGKDTAASIPGAKLLMIEGMGHALPIPMWPQIIGAIDTHARGAAAKAA